MRVPNNALGMKKSTLLISVFLVIILLFTSIPVFADDVADKVNVNITVPTGPVAPDSRVSITIDFTANTDSNPATHVKGGDTLTVTWGSEDEGVRFDPNTNSHLELKDTNTDQLLATAQITATGAIITFTDGVDALNNIQGGLEVNGYVRNNNDAGGENGTITIYLSGQAPKTFEVQPGGGYVQSTEDLKKSGFAQVIEDQPYFTWTLMLNGKFNEDFASDVTVTDTVAGKGHEFVTGDSIVKVLYARITDKDEQFIDAPTTMDGKNVEGYRKTKGYYYGATNVDEVWANHNDKFVVDFRGNEKLEDIMNISFSDDNSVMTIVVPKGLINGKYIEIIYYTTPIVITDDNVYKNEAKMEWTKTSGESASTEWDDDFEYYDSTGRISGIPNGTFKLVKYEEGTTTPIAGVKFRIEREDGNPFKDMDLTKEVTTDEKGEASISNLAPGTYIVTEISAPDAYIVSTDEYKFVMVSAGLSHTFYNSKKEEKPETTKVTVEKTWDDWDDLEGKRPTSVTVRLLADGKEAEVTPLVLNEENNWSGGFTNLPKTKDGKAIKYTVKEDAVDFYIPTIEGNVDEGYTIRNMSRPWIPKIPSTPGKYGVLTVVKTVTGDVAEETEFEFVAKVTFADGTITETPFKLKPDHSYIMDNLPEGSVVEITEKNASEYTVTYKVDGKEGNEWTVIGDGKSTIRVNNDKPAPPKKEEPKPEKKDTPTTGDENHLNFWIVIFVGAAAVLRSVYSSRKKA